VEEGTTGDGAQAVRRRILKSIVPAAGQQRRRTIGGER